MKKHFLLRHSGIKEGIHYLKCGKGNEIIKSFWQNIIIIVSIIIVALLLGRIIFEGKADKYDEKYVESMVEANASNDVDTPDNVAYSDDTNVSNDGVSSDDNKDDDETTQTVKRAYLTFDDGPSKYTDEILDILAENNVKATFFVIGKDETYYDKYRRIVEEGHTLALHSYSHKYDDIYSSVDNFARDIEELCNLLYDVTGVECIYYRFPGGSSNTVSSVSMSKLIDYVNAQGLVYFDWNVLNGDSISKELTAQELVDNVMEDVVKYDDAVILMHDLEDRHTTVDSLQQLIDELQEAGYEILPIDENTPLIRHTVD